MTMRAVIGMLVVLLASAGCASTSTSSGTGATSGTLDRIKATKTINLGYRDPRSIRVADYQNREDESILYVPKAGEMLYRLKFR